MYYVYILRISSRRLYIGYTPDLKRRFKEHQRKNKKYPIKLVYYEAYQNKQDALRREKQLKKYKSAYGHLKKRIQKSLNQ